MDLTDATYLEDLVNSVDSNDSVDLTDLKYSDFNLHLDGLGYF